MRDSLDARQVLAGWSQDKRLTATRSFSPTGINSFNLEMSLIGTDHAKKDSAFSMIEPLRRGAAP
jgi:hypothetical protein